MRSTKSRTQAITQLDRLVLAAIPESGKAVSKATVAQAVGRDTPAVAPSFKRLLAAGAIKERAPRDSASRGKWVARAPWFVLPDAPAPAAPSAILCNRWGEVTRRGREVLAVVAGAARPMRRWEISKAVGITRGSVTGVLNRLIATGHLLEGEADKANLNVKPALTITPKGLAEANGTDEARAEHAAKKVDRRRDIRAASERRRRRAERSGALRPEPKAPAAPKAPPPSSGASPLPPPALPDLPAAVMTFRGIKHPPIPQAFARPAGIGVDRWEYLTTLKGPARRAA